jgi:hypothetical protein
MVGISGEKESPTKYKWRVDHVFYQSIDQFKKIVTAFKDEPQKKKKKTNKEMIASTRWS